MSVMVMKNELCMAKIVCSSFSKLLLSLSSQLLQNRFYILLNSFSKLAV